MGASRLYIDSPSLSIDTLYFPGRALCGMKISQQMVYGSLILFFHVHFLHIHCLPCAVALSNSELVTSNTVALELLYSCGFFPVSNLNISLCFVGLYLVAKLTLVLNVCPRLRISASVFLIKWNFSVW